jgi:hypothetical protein
MRLFGTTGSIALQKRIDVDILDLGPAYGTSANMETIAAWFLP